MHRRIAAFTLAVSIFHGVAIWVWREPFGTIVLPHAAETEVAVALVLPPSIAEPVPPVRHPDGQDKTAPETEPVRRASARTMSKRDIAPAIPGDERPPPALSLAPRQLFDSSTAAEGLEAPRPTPGLEFRPEFSDAVQKRRERQTLQRSLGASRISRSGHDADTYNQVDSANRHLKTEQGCFDRRSDVAGAGRDGTGGERFWMTRCIEARRSDGWELEGLAGE